MQLIQDIYNFLSTLSFLDIVFFFSVVALMLLIITLINFVLENKINVENPDENPHPEELQKEIESKDQGTKELLEIAAALEQAEPTSNLNHYEEDQEEKAIISYDELLERTNEWAINYSEEENVAGDLTIKKVDLNNLTNKEVSLKPNIKVSLISYEKEEAFLAALKELQKLLN